MDYLVSYICVAAAAFATTFACVPLAKRLAIRLDAVDYPSKRRINKVPIPRMGGVAVFAGLVVACIVQLLGTWYLGWPPVLIPHPSMTINYPMLGVSFLLIFLTGAVDDVVSLRPRAKLAGQVLAACVTVASGVVIHSIVNPFGGPHIQLGWIGYPLTVAYLVAYSNIINLVDGLDGLASGISAIAGLSMFSFAVLAGRVDAAALSLALVGCCLAFLRYNFHPASIFLGDSGALLLGFALGTVSLLNVSRTAALTSLIIPLVVAGVPILDTLAAIIRRMRGHVSIGQADKGHIQHRLIEEGYDQRQAVMLIYLWCILLSIGAATINQVSIGIRIAIFVLLLVCSVAFAMRLHLFEPVLRHHYNPKTHEDELVTPDNPAFAEEERAQKEHRRELREQHRENLEKVLHRKPARKPRAGSSEKPHKRRP